MVFKMLNGITYTEDICASLCYTHVPSTPACHFFVFTSGAANCILGNFNYIGSENLNDNTFTAYYNESMYTSGCEKGFVKCFLKVPLAC